MKLEFGRVSIDVARELVEEALMVASRHADSSLRAEFREEMEAVQSIETIDIRETRFEALDSYWMERFRVAETLKRVLALHPGVEDLVSACFLKLARGKHDEKAFLYDGDARGSDSHGDKPALVVQLTVDTLLAVDELDSLLRATLTKARR